MGSPFLSPENVPTKSGFGITIETAGVGSSHGQQCLIDRQRAVVQSDSVIAQPGRGIHEGWCDRISPNRTGCTGNAGIRCRDGVAILQANNRTGECRIGIAVSARCITSVYGQRDNCNRQSTVVRSDYVIAELACGIHRARRNRVRAHCAAGCSRAGERGSDVIAILQSSNATGKGRVGISVEPRCVSRCDCERCGIHGKSAIVRSKAVVAQLSGGISQRSHDWITSYSTGRRGCAGKCRCDVIAVLDSNNGPRKGRVYIAIQRDLRLCR